MRPFAKPLYPQGGIAVLKGNLAPGGAIIKQSAADPKLMEHEGRAVVFENAADLAQRIDSDDLDVRAEDILVLKNIGPKGAPRVRLKCSPSARCPRWMESRGASPGQCAAVTKTLVAESRRAADSSPMARATPKLNA